MGTRHQPATTTRAVDRAVIRPVARRPRIRAVRLAAALDVAPDVVDRACLRLQCDGAVRAIDGGEVLTARGERRLRAPHRR